MVRARMILPHHVQQARAIAVNLATQQRRTSRGQRIERANSGHSSGHKLHLASSAYHRGGIAAPVASLICVRR